MIDHPTDDVLKAVIQMARRDTDKNRAVEVGHLWNDIEALCDLLEAERARVRELEAELGNWVETWANVHLPVDGKYHYDNPKFCDECDKIFRTRALLAKKEGA